MVLILSAIYFIFSVVLRGFYSVLYFILSIMYIFDDVFTEYCVFPQQSGLNKMKINKATVNTCTCISKLCVELCI